MSEATFGLNIELASKTALSGIQQIIAQLNAATTAASKATSELNKLGKTDGVKKTKDSVDGLTGSFDKLGLSLGKSIGLAVAGFVTATALAIKNLDQLNTTLEIAVGKGRDFDAASQNIRTFAVQFGVARDEVSALSIALGRFNFDNSLAGLTAFGNLATAAGIDLKELSGVIADIAQGDVAKVSKKFEDLGLTFRRNGAQVIATFKGVDTNLGTNSRNIAKYIEEIGKTNFAGALEKQANSINGTIGRLQQSFVTFAENLKNSPIGKSIGDAFSGTDIINTVNAAFNLLIETLNIFTPAVDAAVGLFKDFISGLNNANTAFGEDITLIDIFKAALVTLSAIVEGAVVAFRIFFAYVKNGFVTINAIVNLVATTFINGFAAIPDALSQIFANIISLFSDLVSAATTIGVAFADAFKKALKGENPIADLQDSLTKAISGIGAGVKPINTGFLDSLTKNSQEAIDVIAKSSDEANDKASKLALSYKGIEGAIESAGKAAQKFNATQGQDAGASTGKGSGTTINPAIQAANDALANSLRQVDLGFQVVAKQKNTLDPVILKIQELTGQFFLSGQGLISYGSIFDKLSAKSKEFLASIQKTNTQNFLQQAFGKEEDLKNQIALLQTAEGPARELLAIRQDLAKSLGINLGIASPEQLQMLEDRLKAIQPLIAKLQTAQIGDNFKNGVKDLNFAITQSQVELDNFWSSNKDSIVSTQQALNEFYRKVDPIGLGANISDADKQLAKQLQERITAQQELLKINQQVQDSFNSLGTAVSNWALNGKKAANQVYLELLKLAILAAQKQFFGSSSGNGTSFFNGLISGITGSRAGGGAMEPGLYRAGENGPETILMSRPGYAIPTSTTASYSGVKSVTLVVQPSFENHGSITNMPELNDILTEWGTGIAGSTEKLIQSAFSAQGISRR